MAGTIGHTAALTPGIGKASSLSILPTVSENL
jgi:hypothetical protein